MIYFQKDLEEKENMHLGKTSGKANIRKNLQELGLTLNDQDLKKVTKRIIELGDKKEKVNSRRSSVHNI